MAMTETVETTRMPDGTEYRAVIEHVQGDQDGPDWDGAWPVLRLDYLHYDWVAKAFNHQGQPYADKFNELWDRLRKGGYPSEHFERYLRIFHGATVIQTFGLNDTRATDSTFIGFDTAEWRGTLGFESDAHAIKSLADGKPLADVQAWLEGDVWCGFIQTRWNPDEALEDDEGWTEEEGETVWGLYGRKYAEETVKENLKNNVKAHRVVYRYPEHEKIAPHQSEIDAIIEFLDSMEDTELVRTRPDGVRVTVTSVNYQVVAFEHFGIDYNKIEQERELMFKRLRESAEEAIDK